MTQDAYWDELGMAWTAIDPQIIAPRLKERLHRQTVSIAVVIFTGVPLSLAGIALGAWTVWLGASAEAGNFVTRGIAIVAISMLAGFAAWSFGAAWKDDTQSLAAMIELALRRAQRGRMAIRSGFACLGIAAVFGMIGYAIRLQMGKPPAMSSVEPLLLLAVLAVVLFLLEGKNGSDIAKYRYLKRLLLED
jgi:hypothetical protein